MHKKKQSSGFTLIELLVVIAIIGILASVILASVDAARSKARDARRKEDFHEISTALALYYAQNGSYPNTNTTSATDSGNYANSNTSWDGKTYAWTNLFTPLVNAGYMTGIPRDPLNVATGSYPWSAPAGASVNHLYHYRSDGAHYLLCTWLENHGDAATLGHADMSDPFNPSLKLHANEGYSAYNYCIAG